MSGVRFALLDQVLVSGSNFLISLALARFLSSHEYGLYIFAFTTLTMLTSFCSSSLFSSISVLCAPLENLKWISYVKTSALIFFFLVIFLVVVLVGIFAWLSSGQFDDNARIFAVIAIILFFYLSHEFWRVILLSRLQAKVVFIGDIICYGIRALGVAGAVLFGFNQGWQLILIFGVASVFSFVYFFRASNITGIISDSVIQRSIFFNIIEYSRWTFAEWIPFVLSSQLYIYIVTFSLGNEATGILGACRNLVMPVIVFLIGVMNYSLPYYSKFFAIRGEVLLLKDLRKYLLILMCVVLMYLFFVNYFKVEIIDFLYGKYVDYSFVVYFYSLGLVLNVLFNPVEIYFRVTRKTKLLFYARVISAIVVTATCYPLIIHFGMKGAVYCYILSQFAMCFSLYSVFFWQKFRV